MYQPYVHRINNYQKEKPFSSFLSGVSGKMGIPMWAFYVNRGQLISSFGVRDKNGAIAEFYPANLAYHYTPLSGFRTFIKVNERVFECFKESNVQQELVIRRESVSIIETLEEIGLKIIVSYFTLPHEKLAGLIRKVELINLNTTPLKLEVLDGLVQILPAGVDFGSYKAMSNLLQSWMQSIHEKGYVFYKLRASTDDSAEVKDVLDGNFYVTIGEKDPFYISDYKLIFDEDTSLQTPYGFAQKGVEAFKHTQQVHVNQVPCAMSAFDMMVDSSTYFYSMIGYASDKKIIDTWVTSIDLTYFQVKEEENKNLHERLVNPIQTRTARPLFDGYLEQCFLDNVLRGGTPVVFETMDGPVSYYLYSRKHGDLERDYNFFHLEPSVYSQGNGNFRDVLQNRRNDIFFHPEIKDFNIVQFGSLIQADGYNPLGIEGISFLYQGDIEAYPEAKDILQNEFTPGGLATRLMRHYPTVEDSLKAILKKSKPIIKASFGEGYWEDHFTYLMDVIESYIEIYPDQLEQLMSALKYPFYVSPAIVLPRKEKHVITKSNTVRQYGAIHHIDAPSSWLKNDDGVILVNLFGKLLTLALNKFGHLDFFGIGLSYEANKPGWNDAANGLPGLFGSGVSEMFELIRIVRFLSNLAAQFPHMNVAILESTEGLVKQFEKHLDQLDWHKRMGFLEDYRALLNQPQNRLLIEANRYSAILAYMNQVLEKAVEKAKTISPIFPTYLTYEATQYTPLSDDLGKPIVGHYGLPLVEVHAFSLKEVPLFLEAPARYLKALASPKEAFDIYQLVKKTSLYDKDLRMYQTSESLDSCSHEIGRLRAFTPGWLERESNFLHMTYKYLLGLLKAGLYDVFYEEIETNFTCFMDSKRYGRSPLENSSFIATSSNPDPKKHGQGFVARLSGSTAEVLSMWKLMFIGKTVFKQENNELIFSLSPRLHHRFFEHGTVKTTLLGTIPLTYHNPTGKSTYSDQIKIAKMVLHMNGMAKTIEGSCVKGIDAQAIRNKTVKAIDVYYEG